MNIRRWKYTDIAPLEKFQLEAGFPDRWNYNMLAQSFLSDRFSDCSPRKTARSRAWLP